MVVSPAHQDGRPSANGTSKTATSHGLYCGTKDLYAGPEDKNGKFNWTETYPKDLEKAAEDESTAGYAMLVCRKRCYNDSRKVLEIDNVVVQSPLLKAALAQVLKDYPGITTSLARLTFAAPFKPFIHRWEQLTEAMERENDRDTKSHLELLHKILKEELKETIEAKDDFVKNKVITYDNLWTIFQPGSTVHTSAFGVEYGAEFVEGAYIQHPKYGDCYQLTCKKVDWNGERFGYCNEQPLVLAFSGTKAITALEAVPLQYHPHGPAIAKRLIASGRLFEKLAGYHYRSYNGVAIAKTPCGPVKIQVDGRIIIDRYAHGRFNPSMNVVMQHLKAETQDLNPGHTRPKDNDDESDTEGSEVYSVDYSDDDKPLTDGSASLPPTQRSLRDDELIHCSSLLRGYSLKAKSWLQFFVKSVTPIQWNEKAFESLVLPEDQKELILSFAEAQVLYKQRFDDVISGKGRGIIMLLSGSPGVGKTLTAESVAEHMRVPLYMLSASDLGVRSHEVDTVLTRILEMVAKWNAVLLLDECDVFLEARNANDLERNKLVSVFLRTLEYYEGILFLTTNRVDHMDAAFQSRIHISMEYPPLDATSRVKVWQNFLDRGIKHELSDSEIVTLAQLELNGRQIKNVLKTSQLLACKKRAALRYEHLKVVLGIEQRKLGSLNGSLRA